MSSLGQPRTRPLLKRFDRSSKLRNPREREAQLRLGSCDLVTQVHGRAV